MRTSFNPNHNHSFNNKFKNESQLILNCNNNQFDY